MIAHATPPRARLTREQQNKFLKMLPLIVRQARLAFRAKDPESREELTAEVVANAYVCFARLVELGRESLAFGTPLGTYAVRQVRAGRRVDGKLNVRDITSRHCQVTKGARVGRLDHYNEEAEEWKEVLVEDRRVGPAAVAATRIDFTDWLRILPARQRRIAKLLATGESTGVTAKRFKVSSGRISQIRGELQKSWEAFQGQAETEPAIA